MTHDANGSAEVHVPAAAVGTEADRPDRTQDRDQDREQERALAENRERSNRHWTDSEIGVALERACDGWSYARIGQALGRSARAVQRLLQRVADDQLDVPDHLAEAADSFRTLLARARAQARAQAQAELWTQRRGGTRDRPGDAGQTGQNGQSVEQYRQFVRRLTRVEDAVMVNMTLAQVQLAGLIAEGTVPLSYLAARLRQIGQDGVAKRIIGDVLAIDGPSGGRPTKETEADGEGQQPEGSP